MRDRTHVLVGVMDGDAVWSVMNDYARRMMYGDARNGTRAMRPIDVMHATNAAHRCGGMRRHLLCERRDWQRRGRRIESLQQSTLMRVLRRERQNRNGKRKRHERNASRGKPARRMFHRGKLAEFGQDGIEDVRIQCRQRPRVLTQKRAEPVAQQIVVLIRIEIEIQLTLIGRVHAFDAACNKRANILTGAAGDMRVHRFGKC
jgi:hypothetical protein